MPDLDDHMDDLFRKAGEHYPLRTQPDGEDAMWSKLRGEKEPVKSFFGSNPLRKREIFLFLLGLFAGSFFLFYFLITNGSDQPDSEKQTLAVQSPAEFTRENTGNSNSVAQVLSESDRAPETEKTDIQQMEIAGFFPNNSKPSQAFIVLNEKQAEAGKKMSENSIAFDTYSGVPVTNFLKTGLSTGFGQITHEEDILDLASVSGKAINNIQKATLPLLSHSSEKNRQDFRLNTPLNLKNKMAAVNPSVPSQNAKKIPFNPRFYWGLTTGIELNQVKNQGMTKAGLNAGVLFGLQIRDRLAVETSVQFDKKRFYSSGEYFKPKKEDMPPDMKIMSLQSNCSLIEIPIALKYDLSSRQNGLYVKGGISSFVMIRESNDYQAMVSGQEQALQKTYRENEGIPAAQLILSAGYTKNLSQKTQLRLEPYVQIPIKGIGVGAMPVLSSGLHLIITRKQ